MVAILMINTLQYILVIYPWEYIGQLCWCTTVIDIQLLKFNLCIDINILHKGARIRGRQITLTNYKISRQSLMVSDIEGHIHVYAPASARALPSIDGCVRIFNTCIHRLSDDPAVVHTVRQYPHRKYHRINGMNADFFFIAIEITGRYFCRQLWQGELCYCWDVWLWSNIDQVEQDYKEPYHPTFLHLTANHHILRWNSSPLLLYPSPLVSALLLILLVVQPTSNMLSVKQRPMEYTPMRFFIVVC